MFYRIFIFIIYGGAEPIRSDGWGYYSYLPAVFDYKDLTFSFSSNPANMNVSVWKDALGHYINKYPVGTAVLESPFFIIVDMACKIFAKELATGYSVPYQVAVLVSTTTYFISGLIFLNKILSRFYSKRVVLWTLVSMCYATNLFHYATYDAAFSHIYSFFLCTLFVWLVMECENNQYSKKINFSMGLCAGLILITRNPNIVILLFYLLYEVKNRKDLVYRVKTIFNPSKIYWNIAGGIIPVMIQCWYWVIVSGKMVIRSYSSAETFNWLLPHITEVLFSVSKGLLFYSPIIGIAYMGFGLAKKYNLPFYGLLSTVLVHLYITSAWDCWQYGGSYGQRPFVDIYVFYAILLGCVYYHLENVNKTSSAFSLLIPIIFINIYFVVKFMLAYWHGILPFSNATMQDIMNVLEWNFDQMRDIFEKLI